MFWTPEPGTQTILTVLIIIFLALNYIGVGLRCFVRISINNSFSYDDWAMLASLVSLTRRKISGMRASDYLLY
jgi:hypothetical protein